MTDTVFRFPAPGPDPMVTDLEGWVKTEGTPTMKTWVQHTSADGSVISGTWEATVGSWHATYKFYEFVHLCGRADIQGHMEGRSAGQKALLHQAEVSGLQSQDMRPTGPQKAPMSWC
jgi:uncharacterized cupin superfamily protein